MGFVKLPDNLTEWAWYCDNNTLSVYIRLIMAAAWKETNYKNVSLKRGQTVVTLPKLAEQSGLSIQQARTILNRLKSTGKITVENTAKFSIITLLEYDCDFENNRQNNSQSTGYQQAGNSQSTGYQQAPYINKLSDNQTINLSETNLPKNSERSEAKKGFEEFWKAYPKKTAKKNAFNAWVKIKPDGELLKTILSALEQQKKSDQWQRERGQFIPYPATWLNGRRWEDECSGECKGEPPKGENSSFDIAEVERMMTERATSHDLK